MRTLNRNKKTIYYAQYAGKTPIVDSNGLKTGEYTISYGDPVAINVNVSANRGAADVGMIGINENYVRSIVTDDMDCPINEETVLWIDQPLTKPHNYVVTLVAKSINSITYAVKKVKVNNG